MQILQSIRQGLPFQLIPRIFFWLTQVESIYRKQNEPDRFIKLIQRPSKSDQDIYKDINRTLTNYPLFQDEKGSRILFYVLKAYANFDSETGYVQGMNIIAAHIILNLDPELYYNTYLSFGTETVSETMWAH